MRIGSIASLGVAGILMMSACSSTSDEQTSKDGNTAVNGNSNAVIVANTGEVVATYPADANAANFTSGERVAANSMRPDTIKKTGAPVSNEDAMEAARKTARPAPDNSTFFSFLSDAGYEVRTFNNDIQLLKAEKKTMGDGKSTVKIFLRGGKVVEVDGSRIPQLSMAGRESMTNRWMLSKPTGRQGTPLTAWEY